MRYKIRDNRNYSTKLKVDFSVNEAINASFLEISRNDTVTIS